MTATKFKKGQLVRIKAERRLYENYYGPKILCKLPENSKAIILKMFFAPKTLKILCSDKIGFIDFDPAYPEQFLEILF